MPFFHRYSPNTSTDNLNSIFHFILFGILLLSLGVIKLFLVHGISFSAACSSYDDLLFIKLAQSIISGNWLGQYNETTLIKGPFYPIWIALAYKLNIPLFLSQQILYCISCITFILYLQGIEKNKIILIIIYCVILFNPMSFPPTAMRSTVNTALLIFIVSFAIGTVININSGWLKQLVPSFYLGVALSAFWLTREEGVWILPFLILLFFTSFYLQISNKHNFKKISLFILPFFILIVSYLCISMINKIYYNTFTVIELNDNAFKSAYGSILRVKQDNSRSFVPVSKKNLSKLYNASPSFNELKHYFEGNAGKSWEIGQIFYTLKEQYTHNKLNTNFKNYITSFLHHDKSEVWQKMWANITPDDSDISGGHFIWAFRSAVKSAGYYTEHNSCTDLNCKSTINLQLTKYYLRLAKEIDIACKNGTLDCYSERKSLMSPWQNQYLYPLVKTFFYSFYYISNFFDYKISPFYLNSYGSEASLKLYSKITNEEIPNIPSNYDTKKYIRKINILNFTGWLYHIIIPYFAFTAIFLHLIITFTNIKKLFTNLNFLIATSLLLSIFTLLFGLSLIHITSFPGIVSRYLAPLYPALLIYIYFIAKGTFEKLQLP